MQCTDYLATSELIGTLTPEPKGKMIVFEIQCNARALMTRAPRSTSSICNLIDTFAPGLRGKQKLSLLLFVVVEGKVDCLSVSSVGLLSLGGMSLFGPCVVVDEY